MAAWSCHKNHAPCAAPSPTFAKVGDGNAISQSRHRRIMRHTLCWTLWDLPLGRFSVMQTVMCMMGNEMTEKYSITEARRNLPRLIREAEHGKTVELTRRGETVAVMVGHRKFERLVAGRRSFAEAYREFKKTVDLAKLNLNPDEIFAGARDAAPGRQVWF